MKLEISLFKFDHKSDYLPYYTKNIVTIKNEKTLLDVLNTINSNEAFNYKANKNFEVCVNGMYTTLALSLDEIVNDFSKELTIEPISIRRAHNDLLIDQKDFDEKLDILCEFTGLEMLDGFIDKELKANYNSYKLYYYASNTMNIEHNYIGDAILLLADDLISKNPKQEANILRTLEKCDYGIEYHTSLENRVYKLLDTVEPKIEKLKKSLNKTKNIKEQDYKVNATKILDFGVFEAKRSITHNFNDFNIAYYHGVNSSTDTTALLDALDSKKISLDSKNDDLAMDSFHINPDLTYKLASRVMLEAFDKSADLLIVDNDETFYLMDYNRKELSRVSGRDILIPIIHRNELEKLATGAHTSVKDTLAKHIVNPELI